MSHNLFNVNFPDVVFKLWKEEGGKSIATPPSFAMNILERLGHLDHWTDNPSLLDEAATSIKELDAYQKSLKSHLNSIQETVDALQDAVRPYMFGKGIDTIPDEILSTIFESFGTESYDTVIQTCSLVSRRFRRVVLNTPRLWCTISNEMANMDIVTQSLERSKSLGLNVQLAHEGEEDFYGLKEPKLDCSDVFDSVLAHSERWESFKLDISPIFRPFGFYEDLEKLTYLPRLKAIYFRCDLEETAQVEDLLFFKSLRAPQLHRLQVVNYLPGPSALSSTLTSLDIEIWNVTVVPRLPHRLYALLKSIPNLAEVSLVLDSRATLPTSDDEFPPYILQKLKTLKFTVHATICDQLLAFRKALITPAIVDFSFSGMQLESACSAGPDGELSLNFLDFMLCHDEYPTLEALSLDFDPIRGRIVGCKIPFVKVPNLRELTLDIQGFYPVPDSSRRMPALRSLTVRNLETDAWIWVKNLWTTLRIQGDLPGLQKVVIGKRTVSQEWVEKCFDDNIL